MKAQTPKAIKTTDLNDKTEPIFGKIKDELFTMTFIIICVGIIFTDAYYQRFGFKNQFLDFSTIHTIYRGLTILLISPKLFIPYLIVILFTLLEIFAINKNWSLFLKLRTPIAYLILFLNLLIIYPLASKVGEKQALQDMQIQTSTLPIIKKLSTEDLNINYPEEKYFLFLEKNDFICIFQGVDTSCHCYLSSLIRIPKSQINEFITDVK